MTKVFSVRISKQRVFSALPVHLAAAVCSAHDSGTNAAPQHTRHK